MRSIKEILEKVKPFYELLLILVLASIFFGLGRLYGLRDQNTPIKIEYQNTEQTSNVLGTFSTSSSDTKSTKSAKAPISKTIVVAPLQQSAEVIGSKSGKKYYFPWCGTVKRILPQNQVHFASAEEAKLAGFTPGGNCKGLK